MTARCSPERCRELVQRFRNQCIVARWLGEQAVGVIRREVAVAWEAGRTTSRTTPARMSEPVEAGAETELEVDAAQSRPVEPADFADVLAAAAQADSLAADELPTNLVHASPPPFEGYDTLPASHIVQRLRRMSADELRDTATYEARHRQRSTVLGMVEQLLDG